MKSLITILTLACVHCGPVPASAIEIENGTVVLTAREWQAMQSCQASGGCYVLTLVALESMVMRAREMALAEAQKAAPICRRWDAI